MASFPERAETRWWRAALSASAGLLLLLAACAAPVQVDRVDLRSAYDELNRTALSSDQLSEVTRTVLRRAALLDDFDAQPDAAIVALRAQAIAAACSGRTSMRCRR